MKKKNKSVYIIKGNGEKEIFDIDKLKSSLRKSGADEDTVREVSTEVENFLKEGMTTSDIYRKAYSILVKKQEKYPAVKYSVRRAILDLGPNGFPFEDFIGEMFRKKGFSVEVGKTVNGFCVLHELDVVAENDKEQWLMEIKFHNNIGTKSDLKTALYVKARFDDLHKGGFFDGDDRPKEVKKTLVTNTKFSSRAIQYGACAGLTMIGWNYPEKGNLLDLIEESGLHPLTCLTSLNQKTKKDLLNRGIVLCRDLKASDGNILRSMKIPENKIKTVLEEIETLCNVFKK